MADPKEITAIRLNLIKREYQRGTRADDISPKEQIAPWLRLGLRIYHEKGEITPDDLLSLDKAGGTDHPDPFFT